MPSWKVTNRASISNQPAWTVGGLGPTVGKGPFASNAIQINANGQGLFRFRTFCPNQLGNRGGGLRNSMFSFHGYYVQGRPLSAVLALSRHCTNIYSLWRQLALLFLLHCRIFSCRF